MPEFQWRLYAENPVAPLRRKSTGAFTPKTKWLLNAENSQAFTDIKLRELWSPQQICGYLKANVSGN